MKILENQKIPESIRKKLLEIKKQFKQKKIIIAYSGGIDSTLILFLAKSFGKKTIACFIKTIMTPKQELIQAKKFTEIFGIELKIIDVNILSNPNIKKNSPRRCYFCKKTMLERLEIYSSNLSFDIIADGTNHSDLSLPRPGLEALEESITKSPLAEVNLTKTEIVELTKILDLPSKNIPSQACLASRIPFNIQLDRKLLEMVDKAEQILREIIDQQSIPLRVRLQILYPERKKFARIEANSDIFNLITKLEIRNSLVKKFKKLGFSYITIDLAGFRSGSMHEIL